MSNGRGWPRPGGFAMRSLIRCRIATLMLLIAAAGLTLAAHIELSRRRDWCLRRVEDHHIVAYTWREFRHHYFVKFGSGRRAVVSDPSYCDSHDALRR